MNLLLSRIKQTIRMAKNKKIPKINNGEVNTAINKAISGTFTDDNLDLPKGNPGHVTIMPSNNNMNTTNDTNNTITLSADGNKTGSEYQGIPNFSDNATATLSSHGYDPSADAKADMSSQAYSDIMKAKEQYAEAEKNGDEAGMFAAHDAAEKIRNGDDASSLPSWLQTNNTNYEDSLNNAKVLSDYQQPDGFNSSQSISTSLGDGGATYAPKTNGATVSLQPNSTSIVPATDASITLSANQGT